MSTDEKAANTLKGPTFRYGPNGEAQIFNHSADVPAGWLDDPAKHLFEVVAEMETKVADVLTMTKKEIIAALKDGGIAFDPRAKAEALHDLLVGEVKKVLAAAEVAFDDACTDAKTLLGLLPPSE